MSNMRDAEMPLRDRIEAAIKRITHREGLMRVPVEATDPDIVLRDCQKEIDRLRAAIDMQPAPPTPEDMEWAGKVFLAEAEKEIDRLTRERDALLEVAQAIEGALRFAPAAEVLDENSPIRDGLRAALAQIEQERSK